MALVSIIPYLSSKWCVDKPFISFIEMQKQKQKHLRIIRTIPTPPGLCCTQRKSSTMCLTTARLWDDDDGDGVQRRLANHHSNVWDDDFIQSLSTPYHEPSFSERAGRFTEEVKEIINSVSVEDAAESIAPLNDLIQRLWMVDSVERLGIDRHFKNEINSALDYVYSYWSEEGIGCGRESVVTDLNSTALGFRILRLHGYPVSSDVLEHFKDQKGRFACSSSQTEGEQISSILNLFRASLIAFPNEKVMDDAQIFSTTYLKEAVQKIPVSSLSRQIEYAMEYGWCTNLPRLEARNYVDLFGHDIVFNEMSYGNADKLLEIAKLDFNIFHSLQQKELKHISRWWKDSGFPEVTFARHRHVEYYTLVSCIATEPKHSAFRIGFAKIFHLITVLDDIYDTFGVMDELKLFTTAVKRWEPSAVDRLPEYMKGVYTVLYETVNEMAEQAKKAQGRETINYARQAWEAYIDSYMKEAEWIFSGCLPTFEEYYENGKISFGYRISVLQSILTLDIPFPHHILQEIDFPSRFHDLASGILRLKGDTRCYKADEARGEGASCISCYMKDNPGSTEKDALSHIHGRVNDLIKELNWELLKPDNNVPISSKKHAFDITRALHHGYIYRDGYSVASKEIKNLVMATVLAPVPM